MSSFGVYITLFILTWTVLHQARRRVEKKLIAVEAVGTG